MKVRILLCDDASFIRDLIKRALCKMLPQCEILEAPDGRRAQALLNRQSVDLILSDWEMPDVSGEELLRWVREQEKFADTPFIMITSLGDKKHIMKAVEAGVSDYLGKPFTGEELTQKVHKALKKVGKLPSGASPMAPSGGGAFSSAELLNTGRSDGMVPTPSADALTSARKPGNVRVKATGLLQGSDGQFKCMVKSISMEEAEAVIKREGGHPELLSEMELTLADTQSGQRLGPIGVYVHGIRAVEKTRDPDFFNLQLRLQDNGNDASSDLEEFLRQKSTSPG
jgi:DNA-binding response OmpR family regulator